VSCASLDAGSVALCRLRPHFEMVFSDMSKLAGQNHDLLPKVIHKRSQTEGNLH